MKPKQFIKTLYEGRWKVQLNQELKEIFEQAFPELVEKEEPFKDGDIIASIHGSLILITDSHKSTAYGFGETGYFHKSITWNFNTDPNNWQKVSPDVWKERLIEECKRRGIWDTPNINQFPYGYMEGSTYNVYYNSGSDILCGKYGWVYKKGVFATPLETITKEEAEKQLGKKIID